MRAIFTALILLVAVSSAACHACVGGAVLWLEGRDIRRVQELPTHFGETVEEVLSQRYAEELRDGLARWEYREFSSGVAFILVLPNDPQKSACSYDAITDYRYIWRVIGGRVVANSAAALELTPNLAPTHWTESMAIGCEEAPIDDGDAARLSQRLDGGRPWSDNCGRYWCGGAPYELDEATGRFERVEVQASRSALDQRRHFGEECP
jgi:hypothetical protein